MKAVRNPFRASLGADPPLLVGRDEVLADFGYALDNGPGTHERITVVTGARGVGKTVLLNRFEDCAKERGWIVLSETATPGFCRRLADAADLRIEELGGRESPKLRGVQAAGFGAQWEGGNRVETEGLRPSLNLLLDQLETVAATVGEPPAGVLITLDELHHQSRHELIELAAVTQHLVREGREISVVLAGIPSAVKPLLQSKENSNPITFIRRANRVTLGTVASSDIRLALKNPANEAGVSWGERPLDKAVAACGGYPFLIQLVGDWTFRVRDGDAIDLDAVDKGISKARRKMGQLVHEPALQDLSEVDRSFLAYMALDDGPSIVSRIAERMGVSRPYAGNYRRRLLDAEMIVEAGYGKVDFALPYMREHLREHAVSVGTGQFADNDPG